MRWFSRKSIIRIGIYFAIPVVFLWAVGCYMTRCYCKPVKIGESVVVSAENLRAHVEKLAGEFGQRHIYKPKSLAAAADYIEETWQQQGYDVVRQNFQVRGITCTNLEITRRGKSRPSEIILVGAHYDTTMGSPGANDNASGAAAMLELSRHFGKIEPDRTIRFVAFTNEELFFNSPDMGSRRYAAMARARGDNIRVMISLETMGCFNDERGSQRYPPVLGWFYSDRGNFIGFVSNLSSRRVMHRAIAGFRGHSGFPNECIATLERIQGIGWSDHAAFWHEGYAAFMITDTALFRYPHYHAPRDLPDQLNYEKLARVAEGIVGALLALDTEE
jgi:hypothetical protein